MAAGYFLIQHRRQLGPKSVWKIRVFTSDTSLLGIPNILFYVDNGEHNPPLLNPDQENTDDRNPPEEGEHVPKKRKTRRIKNMGKL